MTTSPSPAFKVLRKNLQVLRPPGVLDVHAEIAGDELSEPVFETLAAYIRERQIVGIGADAEGLRSFGALDARRNNRR